ncbi:MULTISPECIES: substrate-binding domain-containing protein [unclassified Methanoculleus]|uniref:substrate-binding domain-containing protein n=1 Tax=unclassified Methanoculleus TaxID=2619537 RepID=UPI0025EA1DE2|nr:MULTISPECIES: substrate-binding domain-containing protein [unclassified Methanoculleus]MCK9317603.1 substrate-binding domain-containing protein [Methanoculleus sp.]MDD2254108.1 substrate-binding domain-containing protein [Methanoculleus sp.]MDD2787307.1 substrate-binding domain-containing protein [Methanoculleus sp.]MDD3215879.1 substrate-binding domain-containing protein [Methanoculleus sp.]MDD4314212.1 substrate-binding domain-containing protein [Methanoculleus sp.]
MTPRSWVPLLGIVVVLLAACAVSVTAQEAADPGVLRIATTTSLRDTGLLDELELMYENTSDVDVQITAQGTGQSLDTARRGDVDLVLVHSPSLEQQFIDEGYGINERCFAYNNFLIVGPESDPAGIANMTPVEAFQAIYLAGTNNTPDVSFASRGDESGTHTREKEIWEAAGYNYTTDIQDSGAWYLETGSGMGETLTLANQRNAYTFSDIGTYLALQDQLALVQLVTEGDQLMNRYSAIAVNPEMAEGVNIDEANNFIDWITSDETKEFIGNFGVEEFGQPLFIPLYPPECTEPPFNCTTCSGQGNATTGNATA